MLRESIYLEKYVYKSILSSCFRIKSCKTNLELSNFGDIGYVDPDLAASGKPNKIF